MKVPRPSALSAALLVAALLGVGCGSDTSSETTSATTVAAAPAATTATTAAAASSSYPVTIQNCGVSTTYTKAPTHIVTVQNSIETMLALGLADKVVGYSLAGHGSGDLPADLQAQLDKLKNLGNEVNKEALVGVQPDIVIGPHFAFSEPAGTTRAQLKDLGINSQIFYETCKRGAPTAPVSFDVIGKDILDLGRIFGVEAKAQQVVASMKATADAAAKKVAPLPRLKVFVYDSGEDAPLTAAGVGIQGFLIESAGGINIFKDQTERSFVPVTWEQVVERNPDVILINDYEDPEDADATFQHKKDFLLGFPPLQSVKAIQDKNIIKVRLNDVFESSGNGRTVETIAKQLYPTAF